MKSFISFEWGIKIFEGIIRNVKGGIKRRNEKNKREFIYNKKELFIGWVF